MKISNKIDDRAVGFSIGSHELHEISETKDLGVFFDKNLSFSTHISSIIAKAKQRLFCFTKVL